jgi:transketolase
LAVPRIGELEDPRDALVDELIAIGLEDDRLVVLDADVSRTSRTRRFRDRFPDRFHDVGVAEQDLFGMAAGLAATGIVPVGVTFAVFASMRAAEPIRTSICYPRLNAKVIGGYAALSNAKDGATHQSLEDVAIMRSFANMVVLTPSDGVMTRKAMRAAFEFQGPVYVRVEYETIPTVHAESTEFAIGRGIRLRRGGGVTIAAYGTAVLRALAAADVLASTGIEADVLDMVSLKPLDDALLLESTAETGRLVVVEDHNIIGGLASAACQMLVEAGASPAFRGLGIRDTYTESGVAGELRDKYGVGTGSIVAAARELASAKLRGPRVLGS